VYDYEQRRADAFQDVECGTAEDDVTPVADNYRRHEQHADRDIAHVVADRVDAREQGRRVQQDEDDACHPRRLEKRKEKKQEHQRDEKRQRFVFFERG